MKIQIELRPFQTPNYAVEVMKPGRRQDGIKEPRSHPLSDLPDDVLEAMCAEFRDEVFRKARLGRGEKGNDSEPRHSPSEKAEVRP